MHGPLIYAHRPFWLSPRQVVVIPVAAPYVSLTSKKRRTNSSNLVLDTIFQKEYATQVADSLSKQGMYADVDNSDNTLQKKIRNGEIARYNFILGTLCSLSLSRIPEDIHLTQLHSCRTRRARYTIRQRSESR